MLFHICIVIIRFCYVYAQQQVANINLDLENQQKDTRMKFLETNQRLYEHLFYDYNPALPPIYTKNLAVSNTTMNNTIFPRDQFGILLMYAKLLEVNPPKQLITLIFEYSMIWRDERLIWDPEEFDGIDHIYVLREKVWVPEITPFDSTEVFDTRPEYKQFSMVSSQGINTFYTSTVTTVNCNMDVTNFPFDLQVCSLKLLSYTFNAMEIELKNEVFPGLMTSAVGNDEWRLLNISARSETLFDESAPTQVNEFTFVMKRNPSYYISLIIIPSFVQTFLCIAGMFTSRLNVDDTEKLSMGLTTIMSSAVTISIVSGNIPKSDKIPKLSNYVTINLLVVSVGIAVVICMPKIGQLLGLLIRCRKKSWLNRWSWLIGALFDFCMLIIFEMIVIFNGIGLLANEDAMQYILPK